MYIFGINVYDTHIIYMYNKIGYKVEKQKMIYLFVLYIERSIRINKAFSCLTFYSTYKHELYILK